MCYIKDTVLCRGVGHVCYVSADVGGFLLVVGVFFLCVFFCWEFWGVCLGGGGGCLFLLVFICWFFYFDF